MIRFSLCRLAVSIAIPLTLGAQGNNKPKSEDKRILWLFTNHRTAEESATVVTLTPRGKFAIAWHDTTDPAIFLQSAFLAGIGQATNANPSFGQGTEGYAKRFGGAYADFALQNLMTEAISRPYCIRTRATSAAAMVPDGRDWATRSAGFSSPAAIRESINSIIPRWSAARRPWLSLTPTTRTDAAPQVIWKGTRCS